MEVVNSIVFIVYIFELYMYLKSWNLAIAHLSLWLNQGSKKGYDEKISLSNKIII